MGYKSILPIATFIFIAFTMLSGAWYPLHHDILYTSDIARDFLLMADISQKKITFIGERASIPGLFHGPLWIYLNYPAFYVSKGNPVAVSWFWQILTIAFFIESFIVAKKLFSNNIAYIYICLLAILMMFHENGLFNPDGGMFIIPIWFFYFVRYIQTRQFRFAIWGLLLTGLLIQFHLAIGIPILMLAIPLLLSSILKYKNYNHLLAFFVLLIPLSTFILFDIRHQFEQVHTIITYITGKSFHKDISFGSRLINRLTFFFLPLNVFSIYDWLLNALADVSLAIFIITAIRAKSSSVKTIVLLFLYFYIGYYCITLAHSGLLLVFYVYPLIPLFLLLFAATVASKHILIKLVTTCVIIAVMFNSFQTIINNDKSFSGFTGSNRDSWVSYQKIYQTLYQTPEMKFGYLIYNPDFFAYQPTYALQYGRQFFPSKQIAPYTKEPITFLVVAPAPADRPYLTDDYWKASKVFIKAKPQKITIMPNQYRIEKYLLSGKDLTTPMASDAEDRLYFR